MLDFMGQYKIVYFGFGLALVLVLLETSPPVGGWLLLVLVLSLLLLHRGNF